MSSYKNELVKLIPHLAVVVILLEGWLAGLPAAATAVAATLAGGLLHTMADTMVEPEHGGDRLRWTFGSNLVFSALISGAITVGLYS